MATPELPRTPQRAADREQPVASLDERVAAGDRQYADVLADIEPYTLRKPAAETGSVPRAA